MNKLKVAYIQYHKIARPTGIGKVCEHFEKEMSSFYDIELIKIKPPRYIGKDNILFKTLNKIIYEVWYAFIVPLIIYYARADMYIEMNMLYPLIRPVKTFFLIYDLAFLKFPDIVTRRNYKRRLNFIKKLDNKSHFFAISESTKKDLCDYSPINPDRVTVCYLASSCPVGNSKRIVEDYDGYFLFVGTIEPRKNLVRLIKGFNQFLDETALNCQLILIGKMGWNTREIMDTIYINPNKQKTLK